MQGESRRPSQSSPAGKFCLYFLLRRIVAAFVSFDTFSDLAKMNILEFEILIDCLGDELGAIPPLTLCKRIQFADL